MVVEEAESAVVVTWKGTATMVVDVDAKLEVESEVIFSLLSPCQVFL